MPKFLFKHENRANILVHYEILMKARAMIVRTGETDTNLWLCWWVIPLMASATWGPSLFHDDQSWGHLDTVFISSSLTASLCCYIWFRWIEKLHARSYRELAKVREYFNKYDIDIGDEGGLFRHKSSDNIYGNQIDPYSTANDKNGFDIDCDYKAAEELFEKVYTAHRFRDQLNAGPLSEDDFYNEWEYTIRSH